VIDASSVRAAANLVGRTGARELEIGYLHDDVPSHLAGWYAIATYKGAKVIVEDQPHPVVALRKLALKLIEGGACTYCLRTVSTRRIDRDTCYWQIINMRWERGCGSGKDESQHN